MIMKGDLDFEAEDDELSFGLGDEEEMDEDAANNYFSEDDGQSRTSNIIWSRRYRNSKYCK